MSKSETAAKPVEMPAKVSLGSKVSSRGLSRVGAEQTPGPVFWERRLVPFLEGYYLLLCFLLVAVACFRIISTYNALSLTNDEPAHFASGMEFIANHVYALQKQEESFFYEQPPLSRAVEALGPYLAGARPQAGFSRMTDEGYAIIVRSGNIDRTIFLMRLGNLSFFLLACVVICVWASRAFGKPVAVLALTLFTLLPPVLADAGVATTDVALAATVGAAFVGGIAWAEKPTWFRSLLLGFFTALAILSKFTALGYVPAALSLALIAHWTFHWPGWSGLWGSVKRYAPMFALAAVVTLLVIWAGYWFSIGAVEVHSRQMSLRVPAPALFDGIRVALQHDQQGHTDYLLGKFSRTGWWYYFPVALLVKLPIAFLILLALGSFTCLRERRRVGYLLPIAFSLGILIPAMQGRIDIGIRHIEPIFIGLSIISAVGLRQLLQWSRTTLVSALSSGALMTWMTISGAVHHPDYFTYFNEFALRDPARILVDSNYDWGQDYKLLSRRLNELGVTEFWLATSWPADGSHFRNLQSLDRLPTAKKANDFVPSPGWTVVSPTYDRSVRFWAYGGNWTPFWYDRATPRERVGALMLYYTPADNAPPPRDAGAN
jgi:hypothetical protein